LQQNTVALMDGLLADRAAWSGGPIQATADPTQPASTLHATFALMQSGDVAEAERMLGWALVFTPEDAGLLRRMSDIALRLGDAAAAEQWMTGAIGADASHADSYAQLAVLLVRRGARGEAEAALGRAIGLAPDRGGLHARLGALHFDAGDWAAAEPHFRRAVDLARSPSEAAPWLVRLNQNGTRRAELRATVD
jgi:tetratricopeptide (TPR) repeat protein